MILVLLKSLWRDDYPKVWGVVFEFVSMIMMLAVFWYTSQAFVPIKEMGTSYFVYLVTSEIILYLPLVLLQQNIRLGKKIARRGTFDFLYVREVSLLRYFSTFTMAYFCKDFVKLMILLVMSILIFGYSLEVKEMIVILTYISILSLLCATIGMGIALLLIFFGRGEGVWSQVISFSSLLAGAYFPLHVFPDWLQTVSLSLNPLTLFLEYGREISFGNYSFPSLGMIIWCCLIPLANYFIYIKGLEIYRKRGAPADITF